MPMHWITQFEIRLQFSPEPKWMVPLMKVSTHQCKMAIFEKHRMAYIHYLSIYSVEYNAVEHF